MLPLFEAFGKCGGTKKLASRKLPITCYPRTIPLFVKFTTLKEVQNGLVGCAGIQASQEEMAPFAPQHQI